MWVIGWTTELGEHRGGADLAGPEIAELANNRGLLTSPRGHASIL